MEDPIGGVGEPELSASYKKNPENLTQSPCPRKDPIDGVIINDVT